MLMAIMIMPNVANAVLFNSSWKYYEEAINSTLVPSQVKVEYPVNGTNGFWIGAEKQIIWGLAETVNTTNRVWYTNYTTYEITNSSNVTLPFEVEVGNQTGINSTLLHDNDEMVHLRCGTNTTGTTKMCTDSSRYGRNFTILNDIWDNGIIGGGARAVGVAATDGLNRSYESWMDMKNFTMLLWVYPITTDRAGPMGIADKPEEDIIQIEYNGALKFLIDNSGSFTRCASSQIYQANNWQMIGISFNQETKNMSIFYNGSLVQSCTSSPNTPMNYAGTGFAFVGGASDRANYPFNGRFDEARIWNRTLTVNEIDMIYQSGKGALSSLGSLVNIIGADTTPSLLIYQYANMSNIDNHSIVWKLNIVVFNNGTTTLTNVVVDGANNFSIANYTIASLTAGASNLSQFAYNLTRENITTGGIDRVINLEPAKLVGNATGSSNALTIVNPVDPPSKLGGGLANCWTDDKIAKTIWIPIGCTFFWAATYFTS